MVQSKYEYMTKREILPRNWGRTRYLVTTRRRDHSCMGRPHTCTSTVALQRHFASRLPAQQWVVRCGAVRAGRYTLLAGMPERPSLGACGGPRWP